MIDNFLMALWRFHKRCQKQYIALGVILLLHKKNGCRLFRYQTFRPGTFRYRHFGTRHFGTGDISVRGHFGTWDISVPSSKWDISVRGHFGPWDISVRGHFGTRDILVLRLFGTRDISAPSNDSLIAFETFCVWNLDWAPAESSLWKEAPLRWIAG